MVSVFFRKVEYLNAKGSFLDSHTIKAVLKNGTEVQKFIPLRLIPKTNCHRWYDIKKRLVDISNILTHTITFHLQMEKLRVSVGL